MNTSDTDLMVPNAALQALAGGQSRAPKRDETYVGIDFGTSTTVVSVVGQNENGSLSLQTVQVGQRTKDGRIHRHHLVPSCLAWYRDSLYIGKGAAELRPRLIPNKNVWTSFKMGLGLDLGPSYPESDLGEPGKNGLVIDRPRHAAREFFRFLLEAVVSYASERGFSKSLRCAVSVPAGFEANQRRDLVDCLEQAGFPLDDSCLIDEPNAALISYLAEAAGAGSIGSLIERMRAGLRVLVFDYGAGTCDVSIVELTATSSRTMQSRNLALSRFHALGGDDIDHALAEEMLRAALGQDLSECFTEHQLEEALRRTQALAERVKIQFNDLSETAGVSDLDGLEEFRGPNYVVDTGEQTDVMTKAGRKTVRGRASARQFSKAMAPFLSDPTSSRGDRSILGPVRDALEKAGLSKDKVDTVLFIGGSAKSPFVRRKIADWLPGECVVPRDLRRHVSQGAAIHAFMFHGMGADVIAPIVAEEVLIVTKGGDLSTILPAGSVVPTRSPVKTSYRVPHRAPPVVDIPICVGSKDKIVTVIEVAPGQDEQPFEGGERIDLECGLTRDKLLIVKVHRGGRRVRHVAKLPMANVATSVVERSYLEALRWFNESLAENRGRPSLESLLAYAHACQEAGRYRRAAELYEAAERLDSSRDFSVQITYCYSRARDRRACNAWAKKAYTRRVTHISAYNYALTKREQGDEEGCERLLRESLALKRDYLPALGVLADVLKKRKSPERVQIMRRIVEYAKLSRMAGEALERGERRIVAAAAHDVGDASVQQWIEELEQEDDVASHDGLYREDRLLEGVRGDVPMVDMDNGAR